MEMLQDDEDGDDEQRQHELEEQLEDLLMENETHDVIVPDVVLRNSSRSQQGEEIGGSVVCTNYRLAFLAEETDVFAFSVPLSRFVLAQKQGVSRAKGRTLGLDRLKLVCNDMRAFKLFMPIDENARAQICNSIKAAHLRTLESQCVAFQSRELLDLALEIS